MIWFEVFKKEKVQELFDGEIELRCEFCELIMEGCNNDPGFIRQTVLATFCYNGC